MNDGKKVNQTTDLESEESKNSNGRKKFNKRMGILVAVGIGAGIYGFKFGYQIGNIRGIVSAAETMTNAWEEHSEELRKSRGE